MFLLLNKIFRKGLLYFWQYRDLNSMMLSVQVLCLLSHAPKPRKDLTLLVVVDIRTFPPFLEGWGWNPGHGAC
jgi:hypothetical protein